jgi:hypothetical protein
VTLARLALRDAAVLAVTLSVWAVDAGLRDAGSGALAIGVALLAGALATLCGYLVHEWGHLLGARAAGAVVHLPCGPAALFLFRFDADRNGRREFLAMSLGGFVASALAIAALLWLLPLDALSGRISLGLVGVGVLATFVLEVPTAWRVARGAALPRGAAYASGGQPTAGA